MKKLMCAALALTLILGALLSFAACKEKLPDGYKLYKNDDISFAYPESWNVNGGSTVILVNETGMGNNVTIAYDNASDIYKTLDVKTFNELIAPQLIAMGMEVSGVAVSHVENGNGVDMTKVTYDVSAYGTTMGQTIFALESNSKTYIITVTEVTPDAELVATVFDTLKN